MKDLRPLVGDLRQLASVRRIVLDDGPERGVRAIAFSTGGGLDFWVLADRSLDIGPLWWRGAPLAWAAPAGFRAPWLVDAESEGGRGFDRGFSGFLVTCGMTHIRQPAGGEPLHGRLPFTPARITACGEDWDGDAPLLYCEGEVVQSRYGGEALRLRRRIEAPVGGNLLRIRDTVENLAGAPTPHAMLYHFNLGYPAVRAGATVALDGADLLGPLSLPETGAPPARTWPAAPRATCRVATPGAAGGLELTLSFDAATLPWLQLWRDLRPSAGVLSLEPCTDPLPAAAPEPLAPGARREYRLEVALAGSAAIATPG